jgi:hypothetical protein
MATSDPLSLTHQPSCRTSLLNAGCHEGGLCDTGAVTVTVKVKRSGLAVLEALREVSPAEAAAFESEYRAALARASESLDLGEAEHVLTHWWGIVSLRLNPLTESERDLVRRFHAGEDVGWSSPEEYRAATDR